MTLTLAPKPDAARRCSLSFWRDCREELRGAALPLYPYRSAGREFRAVDLPFCPILGAPCCGSSRLAGYLVRETLPIASLH
jgi:hypothetical protein